MTTNHTNSGYTAMQVGRIVPRGEGDTEHADRIPPAVVEVRNVRRGNATVGAQYDAVTVGFTVVRRGR